jgi:hypothetical protein
LTVYVNLTVGGLWDGALLQGSRGFAALLTSGGDVINESVFHEIPTTPIRRRGESGLAVPSLALVARKKERRSKCVGLPFQRNKILTDAQQALVFYRCFPFKEHNHKMHTLIDLIGITVVVVQVVK